MKVLILAPDFYPNSTGFANATYNMLDAIKKIGGDKYDISVFTDVDLKGNNETDIVKVHRYRNTALNNRFTRALHEYIKFRFLDEIIGKEKFDIIFLETNNFPVVENLLVNKYRDKMVVRIHSTMDTEIPIFFRPREFYLKYDYYLMRKFMQNVKYIVSTSEYYIDFIKKYYFRDNTLKIWDDKFYGIINNTADADPIRTSHTTNNRFFTLGKMSEGGYIQKGIIDLLRSIYILESSHSLPDDFILYMVGDGKYIDKVKSYCNKLDIDSRVVFCGNVKHDQVINYFATSKAVILLSRFEGQSMFITEALANGKPLIITKNNGMEEMVTDGVNGILVKTGDPYDSAKAIYEMICFDDGKIAEMGNNSKRIFDEKYSKDAIYKQFDEFVSMIL